MNVLFSGGDNWWPAIIGSKAVGFFDAIGSNYVAKHLKKLCGELVLWRMIWLPNSLRETLFNPGLYFGRGLVCRGPTLKSAEITRFRCG